jgi:hypothetical protein
MPACSIKSRTRRPRRRPLWHTTCHVSLIICTAILHQVRDIAALSVYIRFMRHTTFLESQPSPHQPPSIPSQPHGGMSPTSLSQIHRRLHICKIFMSLFLLVIHPQPLHTRQIYNSTNFPRHSVTIIQMMFRRRSRSHDSPVVQILGDCSVQLSPTKGGKTVRSHAHREAFVMPSNIPSILHHRGGSSDDSYHSGDSSPEQSPKARKEEIPKQTPTSWKTGFATIRTDSTDAFPAFESDAFAVLMPTTRLPILNYPKAPRKVASPTAQADALRTYQEKAKQNRERNNSQGVKVPSRIVSYDYASRHLADQRTSAESGTGIPTAAGSFPISPPVPQHKWARSEKKADIQVERSHHVTGLRSVTTTLPKPVTVDTKTTTAASTTSCYRVYRPSASSPLPPSITVRIKPKAKVTTQDAERVQTESIHKLYNRPFDTSTSQSSRDSSPVKSMPNFTRHNSVEGDSIFGYRSKNVGNPDGSATSSGAEKGKATSPTSSDGEKRRENAKAITQSKIRAPEKAPAKSIEDTTPKRTLTQRWPWLRPAGPRIAKPTTAPVVFTAPATQPAPRPFSTYVDPFERLATPVSHPVALRSPVKAPSRPATPKKTLTKPIPTINTASRPITPRSTAPPSPTGKFDSGFAQIKTFARLLAKFCFMVYAVVALWYILDAVREAIHTIGVPFRVVRWVGGWVWFWVCWVGGIVGAIVGKRG